VFTYPSIPLISDTPSLWTHTFKLRLL